MTIKLSENFTYKKLLRFTAPAIIMMIFTSLYSIVDGVFVTNFAGKTALAGINFAFPIINILATFGYMFGAGGSALVAKTLGERNPKKANSLFSLFVYTCFLVGVLFSVLGFFLLRPLMSAFGAQGEMLDLAVIYGKILLISLPLWNLQFLFQIFFVTAERAKLGLIVTLIAGFTNMGLDALFVAVFKLGLVGAAVATAVSQIVGGIIPTIYFFSKNTSLLRLGKTQIDFKALLKATSNGLSEFVTGVSSSLVGILYNVQLLKIAGETAVASYSIMMYVSFIFVAVFLGYTNGVGPIVGYNFGAKNYSEQKGVFKKSVAILTVASLLMFALSESLALPLSKLFASYDKGLFDMTLIGFRIYSLSFLFSGIAIFSSGYFTALNNGIVSAVLSFLRTIIYQVSCVFILPLLISGVYGVWLSIVISELLAFMSAIVAFIIFRKKYQYA